MYRTKKSNASSSDAVYRTDKAMYGSHEVTYRGSNAMYRGNEVTYRGNEVTYRGGKSMYLIDKYRGPNTEINRRGGFQTRPVVNPPVGRFRGNVY